MTKFLLENFEHRVRLPFKSLEETFEIQEWCVEKFGDPDQNGRWTLGYSAEISSDYQNWYFTEGKDALLFKLRWE